MKKLLTLTLFLNFLLFADESINLFDIPLTQETPQKESTTQNIKYLPYDEAIKIAKAEDKMIMIKMTAEHCHYCKKMDIKVMIEPEIVEALKKDFVSVEIDVEMDEIPLGLRKMMTPSFVFVTNNEDVVSIVPGSFTKEAFLEVLKKAKDEVSQ